MQIAHHRVSTARQNFHGSGVSILKFLTSKNVGQVRVRKPFKDLSEAEINFSTAMDSFITVRGGEPMTTNGDFWGLMGTKIHGDSRSNR